MKNEILQGEAAPPLAEGRYRLLSVLGVGGMATVYRGYDARLQVYRAVKVLAPALARRKSLKTRFEAEAKTMALLQHRNIVSVHDVGADGNRLFIVMEMVEGGSLLDRVREYGPLPPQMGLDVTIRMLDALRVAHRRGVVHRDIKPHNILLTPEGDIRITDFGIAQMRKSEEDDDGLTKTGAVMGTWGFMAPEQRQDTKTVDFRADIYSVGATLYSVLTDKTPVDLFAADMDASMMADLPLPVAEIIKTATRYNRDERFPDAQAMVEACRAALELLAPDPPETPPLALPARHDNLEPPQNAPAGGGWGQSGSGASGADLPDLPEQSQPSAPPVSPSLPPPPMRSATTNGGTLIPSVARPIPRWRAPREPQTGETAVPEDGTDISDYLEPAESDERPRNLAQLLPEPGLGGVPGGLPLAQAQGLATLAPLPVPPLPPPPVLVSPPPATDRRVMGMVLFTSVLAALTLVAVLALLVTRPWESQPLAVPGPTPPGTAGTGTAAGTAGTGTAAGTAGTGPGVGTAEPTPPGPDGTAPEAPAGTSPAPEGSPPTPALAEAGRDRVDSNRSGGREAAPPPSRDGAQTTEGTTQVLAVSAPPEQAPPASLRHSPPAAAMLGQTLTLTVTLPTDAYDVTLRHRPKGGSWSDVRMMGSGGRFSGSFPVDEGYVAGVEYFIRATPHGGGEALTAGSGFKPIAIPARR